MRIGEKAGAEGILILSFCAGLIAVLMGFFKKIPYLFAIHCEMLFFLYKFTVT